MKSTTTPPTNNLDQGIAAAKAGDKQTARRLLLAVVEADESNLHGWMWLSYVTDNLEDKQICFENILTLEPDNRFAQKGMVWLTEKQSLSQPETPSASPNVFTLSDSNPAPPIDEFDNEWLCPYCLSPVTEQNYHCPHCHNRLVIRQRVRPDRSPWLWRAIFVQVYTVFYTIAITISYLGLMGTLKGIENPFIFWPIYIGQPVNATPDNIQIVLSILPQWAVWGATGVAIYSTIIMALLYLRISYGHLLYLLNAGMMLVIGLMGILGQKSGWITAGGVLGLLLGLLQLVITLNLWKDFTFTDTRLRLTVDKRITTAANFFLTGRDYAKQGMWGSAAIHLRRAIGKNAGNPNYQLALAVAWFNLEYYDRAKQALAEAEKLAPHLPEIHKLRHLLATREC